MFSDQIGQVLGQHRQVLGVFSNRELAAKSFDRLILSGFPVAKVFWVGREDLLTSDGEDQNAAYQRKLNAQMQVGAITGTATGLKKGLVMGNILGGTTGLLLGLGMLALPGVGQVVLSSAIVFTLLSGGVCTAAGGIIGALIGLGLTAEQVKKCSHQVSEGCILLVVDGTDKEIAHAQKILES